ncbi:unnamed protein product [Effrenium voratum]|uniref:Uncharacterized protein n=1 Tax=Effrenium voratum TaxID=2562239 RepID=A0AA36NJU6_9DINO|nr:unnamed protein product [Effrenium voratum]
MADTEEAEFKLATVALRLRQPLRLCLEKLVDAPCAALCRNSIIQGTLLKGVPFPWRGQWDNKDRRPAWRYLYCPTEHEISLFKEELTELQHLLLKPLDLDACLGGGRQWHFVVDHLAVPKAERDLDPKTLRILASNFQDPYIAEANHFESLLLDWPEAQGMLSLQEQDLRFRPILEKKLLDMQELLQRYYESSANRDEGYYRQLGHKRLSGQTLLNRLVRSNLSECVRHLLERCSVETVPKPWMLFADLMYPDELGNTAMHVACQEGHLESLKVLLDHIKKHRGSTEERKMYETRSAVCRDFDLCDILGKTNASGYTCHELAELHGHTGCKQAVQDFARSCSWHWPSLRVAIKSGDYPTNELVPGEEDSGQLDALLYYMAQRGMFEGEIHVTGIHISSGTPRAVRSLFDVLQHFQLVVLAGRVSWQVYSLMLHCAGTVVLNPSARLQELRLDLLPLPGGLPCALSQSRMQLAVQVLAQQMVELLGRPWKVWLKPESFELLGMSRVWPGKLLWIERVSDFLTDKKFETYLNVRPKQKHNCFLANPFNEGLLVAFDWAFGSDTKHLEGHNDIGVVLEKNSNFFLYVEQLLTTWSDILRSVCCKNLSDRKVCALVEELDHAAAAMLHTLNHLAYHVSARREWILSLIKSFLDSAKSCEKDLGRCLAHAQSQGPCILLQCFHGFGLLKETPLAQSFDWKQHEHAEWAKGALVLVPPERLSEERKWLLQKLAEPKQKQRMEKIKDAKKDLKAVTTLHSVLMVESHQVKALEAQLQEVVKARRLKARGNKKNIRATLHGLEQTNFSGPGQKIEINESPIVLASDKQKTLSSTDRKSYSLWQAQKCSEDNQSIYRRVRPASKSDPVHVIHEGSDTFATRAMPLARSRRR